MVRKSVIGVISLVIIGYSFIILLPVPFLSIKLSSYNKIEASLSYPFNPSSPSQIEKLYINADVGNVEIQYITLPVNYHVMLDVNLEMSGAGLTGKNYTDFFNIIWETTNSSAYLNVNLLSESWFNNAFLVEINLVIQVTIRADVIFDIMTNLGKGNFEITVPYAVSIGNLYTNVSEGYISYNFNYCQIEGKVTGNVDVGDILYNFEHCTIKNNISGTINEGNIELQTDDTIYTRNSIWDFNIISGNIDLFIHQFEDIGANITGFVRITSGFVFILYEDKSPDIGAILEIPFGNEFMPKRGLPDCLISVFGADCSLVVFGFKYPLDLHTYSEPPHEGTVFFTSNDLLANIVKYYYNITFQIQEGEFDMELTSF